MSEVSPITVEALQYRINPSLHEPEKQTVESLLYIPPSGKKSQVVARQVTSFLCVKLQMMTGPRGAKESSGLAWYVMCDFVSVRAAIYIMIAFQGNGRLKVYDVESKCFESDIKITESKHGRSVRLVGIECR